MKLNKYFFLLALVLNVLIVGAQPSIIPLPREYKAGSDSFNLNNNVALVVKDGAFADEANYLQKELLK